MLHTYSAAFQCEPWAHPLRCCSSLRLRCCSSLWTRDRFTLRGPFEYSGQLKSSIASLLLQIANSCWLAASASSL